jgi:hypothetical protein
MPVYEPPGGPGGLVPDHPPRPGGHNSASVAAYCEQMVKISLGPKGAFDNGNIGSLMRWLAAVRVVIEVKNERGGRAAALAVLPPERRKLVGDQDVATSESGIPSASATPLP